MCRIVVLLTPVAVLPIFLLLSCTVHAAQRMPANQSINAVYQHDL